MTRPPSKSHDQSDDGGHSGDYSGQPRRPSFDIVNGNAPWWVSILRREGFATLIVLFGGWFVSYKMAIPLIDSYQSFISQQVKISEEIGQTQKTVIENQKVIIGCQQQIVANESKQTEIMMNLARADCDRAESLRGIREILQRPYYGRGGPMIEPPPAPKDHPDMKSPQK